MEGWVVKGDFGWQRFFLVEGLFFGITALTHAYSAHNISSKVFVVGRIHANGAYESQGTYSNDNIQR